MSDRQAGVPERDLKALPMAHLHLHLEGAMRPSTLSELAAHYRMPAPVEGDGSFETFIRLYRSACESLRSPDDLARLLREIAEDGVASGAVWVEPSAWLTASGA